METFEISNITVKPPRLDPKTGKDLRKAIERVGHGVSYREGDPPNDRVILLMPGRPRLLHNVPASLLTLREQGYVSIKRINSVVEKFEGHTYKAPPRIQQMPKPKSEERYPAKVAEAGAPSRYEGAVNPDGDPNFVVVAPSSTPKETPVAAQEQTPPAK